MILEDINMSLHTDFIIVSVVITLLAIEIDKFTNFTHPSLHWVALAGMAGVMYSLVAAI
jgi:hypothetical protein